MPRIIFEDKNQRQFLQNVKRQSGLNNNELSLICGISERTFRDWLRVKHTISERALLALIEKLGFERQKRIKVVDDFWYVRKGARDGALKRLELYGPPGTPEGRIKGGRVSQLRRRENPEKYRLLGCKVKKFFKIDKPSIDFAETAGIILGDGGITNRDLTVTLSSLVDAPYSKFVVNLLRKVFGERPKVFNSLKDNTLRLTINGVGLVEELERWDFIRGSKVKNQVDFPNWVWQRVDFQIACVRGLMDTDGGCYFHKHKTNDLFYKNFGMCFTNYSLPIVQSVSKVLELLGLKYSIAADGKRIYIHSFNEVKKYFKLVGSNNPKNNEKFKSYLGEKSCRMTT